MMVEKEEQEEMAKEKIRRLKTQVQVLEEELKSQVHIKSPLKTSGHQEALPQEINFDDQLSINSFKKSIDFNDIASMEEDMDRQDCQLCEKLRSKVNDQHKFIDQLKKQIMDFEEIISKQNDLVEKIRGEKSETSKVYQKQPINEISSFIQTSMPSKTPFLSMKKLPYEINDLYSDLVDKINKLQEENKKLKSREVRLR